MEAEARIRRMEEAGTITASQAAMLRESLGGAGRTAPPPGMPRPRRRWAGALALAGVLALAAVVVALVIAGDGGAPPVVQDVAGSLNRPGEYGGMNRAFSGTLAVAVLLIVPLLLFVWLHNSLVAREERTFEAWAQTESNIQRRADLVPVLVDSVTRYLDHERGTFVAVTDERGAADDRTAAAIEELIRAERETAELLRREGARIIESEEGLTRLTQAQAGVAGGVRALLATAEAYPALRSSDQFLELQAQLEGTENRINVARMRFNAAVRDFNAAIRRMPGSLVARLGEFQRKAYFQAEDGARDAPDRLFR